MTRLRIDPRVLATAWLAGVFAAPMLAQERPATQPDRVAAETAPADRPSVSVGSPAGDEVAKPPAATPAELALRNGLDGLRRDILGAPFSVDQTIGQFAGRVQAVTALDAAIQSAEQPGGPRWRDGVCELRVELPGSAVATVLADAVRQRSSAAGMSAEALERRLAHVRTQRYSAIGRSQPISAPPRPAVATPTTVPAIPIPADPPAWVRDQMDADGRGGGPGLKGARAGEAVALSQLRTQVNALVLSPAQTIGQAARQDERIDKAVSTAIRQARVSRVVYADDAVEVRVSLDLAHVWRELVRIR